jgi:putative copper export protein/mono/diheme cytochrome c family protein
MHSLATITALLRGGHLAAMLSLLGTAGVTAWMLPAAAPASLHRSLARLWWSSWLLAVLTGVAWLALQAAAIADAATLSELLDALPPVAMQTRYGNVVLIRLGLLLAAALPRCFPIGRGARPVGAHLVLALTAAALGLQGFIGHVGAADGATGDSLVLSEALHLVAAGLWLGALIPLWLSLKALSSEQAALVCERFSPIGLGCVLVLAGSGLIQAVQLVGSLPALVGTAYGQIALLKIALFLAALALAAVNRLWLTDRLASHATAARRTLLTSVGIETLFGLAIVTAAGFLASTMPAVHSTVVWPFSWQFSLAAVTEDADLRREVVVSVSLIAGGVLLVAAATLWRRYRLPAVAILAAIVLQRAPSFALLTADAYPTSFQTSPTGFTAQSIARGQTLFVQNCVVCHGPQADGNGAAAAGLPIKPADLTMRHIMAHTDGEMFWWLTHGIDAPEGGSAMPGLAMPGLAMPGFGAAMSDDDRWALIDYIRAHYAGAAMQRDSAFYQPVAVPGFPVVCNGVAASTTTDLLGHALLVVIGEAARAVSSVALPPGAITLVVPSGEAGAATPPPGDCAATDPAAWTAFAVLANLAPDKVAGAEFLVDPGGWLRAVRPPGKTREWQSADNLLTAIHEICIHPIEQSAGGQHGHHH